MGSIEETLSGLFQLRQSRKKVFLTLTPDQKEREDENLKVILRLSEPTIEVDNPS